MTSFDIRCPDCNALCSTRSVSQSGADGIAHLSALLQADVNVSITHAVCLCEMTLVLDGGEPFGVRVVDVTKPYLSDITLLKPPTCGLIQVTGQNIDHGHVEFHLTLGGVTVPTTKLSSSRWSSPHLGAFMALNDGATTVLTASMSNENGCYDGNVLTRTLISST